MPEAGNLGKHEPHPVTGLASLGQFADGQIVDTAGVLGGDKTLEFEGVVDHRHRAFTPTVGGTTAAANR